MMDYNKNVELAIAHRFQKVLDPSAYNGCYYIKDHNKWIHKIDALKSKLGVSSDEELISLDYDVESYYKYHTFTDKMVDNELIQIYNGITHSSGEPTYLHDGVWLYPDGTLEDRKD